MGMIVMVVMLMRMVRTMIVPVLITMSMIMGMVVRMFMIVDLAVAMVVRMGVAVAMIMTMPMHHLIAMRMHVMVLIVESGLLTCLQVEDSGFSLGAAATGSAHQAASSISISRIFSSSPASRSTAREPQAQAW